MSNTDGFVLPSDAPAASDSFALPSDTAASTPAPTGTTERSGPISAFGAGAVHGATAGWSDEASAAAQASGIPQIMSPLLRMPVGAARLAYEHFTGTQGPATAEYN